MNILLTSESTVVDLKLNRESVTVQVSRTKVCLDHMSAIVGTTPQQSLIDCSANRKHRLSIIYEARRPAEESFTLLIDMKSTFLHSGEVGPLLSGQLHLSPDDLKRDAIAVRRICRLKNTNNTTRKL